MTDVHPSEVKYAEAMRKVFTDAAVQKKLEHDPVGTLEGLGFDLSADAKHKLKAGGAAQAELGVAAVPAVLVRVVTSGTRPAVSVVVQSSTFASTRGKAAELD
ncbi:MAG: hypothetical protein WDM86_06200 [Rhizomicrobium sp.]